MLINFQRVIDLLLPNTKRAIFQEFHDENELHID